MNLNMNKKNQKEKSSPGTFFCSYCNQIVTGTDACQSESEAKKNCGV